MAGNSFQKKLDQTANLLQNEESYYSKGWNTIFEKYQNVEDSYDLSLEELENALSPNQETSLHDSSPCQDPSSESLSSSEEESDTCLETLNLKPDPLSPAPESHRRIGVTTRSLSLSTDSCSSLNSSGKVLELNIDKLSSPSKLSPPTPEIKKNKKISNYIKTKRGNEDFLTQSTTQEIKLVQKQLFLQPSKARVSSRALTRTTPFRFATMSSEEVPAEVEHIISTAYKEFMNTDMIQVLRGILTFRNYKFRAERHSKILTPYIETSIKLPLKIRDENFILKLTPLSLIKNLNNFSQISCSPNQLALRDRPQVVPFQRSEYTKSSSTKHNIIKTSFPLTNGTGLMRPIKLLETSPFNSTPHSNRAITSQLRQEYTSTPKSSRYNGVSSNTTHTTATATMVHQSNTNNRKVGLFNVKLLDTSADFATLHNAQKNDITPVRGAPLKPNHQTHQFNVRLLETTPTTKSIKRYVEPTRLPTISNSVDQELKLVPLDYSTFPNSTPVKRTLSKIIDNNLSKRVRLDTYRL